MGLSNFYELVFKFCAHQDQLERLTDVYAETFCGRPLAAVFWTTFFGQKTSKTKIGRPKGDTPYLGCQPPTSAMPNTASSSSRYGSGFLNYVSVSRESQLNPMA
ncbi:unnamed protein product [Callosobruchus maculatus]|uniref:Uncharacterized protein n=1 Tax=Callosobruchus maculatus TaxID=64391 RepID=A0A653BSD2_CALMS|nr:unnamed protein product [Callosobruchus maculatus]